MLQRRAHTFLSAALLSGIISGCGGGGGNGQVVQVDPAIEQKNKDMGQQIRKDMEAKYKNKSAARR